jgi:DNA-binding MarR family transcriptional regulator
LARASFALANELSAALAASGVSPRSYCVLTTAVTGEQTQTELARRVGLDKTTMVVTIDELEAAGLAVRRPSPSDRRARVIAVTKAGERKLAEAHEIVERIQADVLASLPVRERKALLEGLARLTNERLAAVEQRTPAPEQAASHL